MNFIKNLISKTKSPQLPTIPHKEKIWLENQIRQEGQRAIIEGPIQ